MQPTYGNLSTTAPVDVNGSKFKVYQSVEASDDNYKSGSTLASDRFPHMGNVSVGDLAPDLAGYNYIPLNTASGAKTISFYVNKSAEIICVAKNELTFVTDDAEQIGTWTHTNAADVENPNQLVTIEKTIDSQGKVVAGGTIKSFLSRRSMNEVNIWTAAAAIKTLGISRDMFLDGWDKATFTYTAAGKTVSDIPQCVFMRYNDLFDYVEKFGNGKRGVSDPDVAERFKTLDAI